MKNDKVPPTANDEKPEPAYMIHRREISWGVIDRESFDGFLVGASYRLLRKQIRTVLEAHALTDVRVGAGYPVCACHSSMHDVAEHRHHVAEQLVEMLVEL